MTKQTCQLLWELWQSAKQTNRNYWIWTELFCAIHGGDDFCTHEPRRVIKSGKMCVLCTEEEKYEILLPGGQRMMSCGNICGSPEVEKKK